MCGFYDFLFERLEVIVKMGLLSVVTARLRVPTVSAFGLIEFFAEGTDKDINMSIRDEKVICSLLALELSLSLFVTTSDTLGYGRWLDTVVKCGDESGR